MTAFIHKIDEDSYDLVAQGLIGEFSMHILSTLFQKDFDLMIEYMEQMRVSKHLPFYYYFPRYKTAPEIDVRLVRNSMKEYQLILNLGARILSDMSEQEFDQILWELKDLRSQFVGHKVYFLPVKDIFKNDK
jgi:hypothetical protein